MAFRIRTTRSFARILTFVIYARRLSWAIRVNHTFRSTTWRCSNITNVAFTCRCFTNGTTFTVWSTWITRIATWICQTWIFVSFRWWNIWYGLTASEWITRFTRLTATNRRMIEHLASCIDTA